MNWQHKQAKLKNGLSLIITPMKTESVTALLLVRVGSRDEDKKINGLAHFMEHMVFKGTKKWPTSKEMNEVIESVGGVFNAYTSQEYTGFWVKLSKKYLKRGLNYLYQSVFEPLLPAEELEKERGVILEEIKMRQDNPMVCVYDGFVSQVYSATPLGQLVIGTSENVKSLKREQFFNHLKNWYQPKNMVLSLAGGVGDEAEIAAEEIFKSEKGGISFADKPKEIQLNDQGRGVSLVKKQIQQAHFCLGMKTFKREDKDRYALAVLKTILGGNTSSRLWDEIREKRGLVYYVRSMADDFYETGYLLTQAGCDVNRLEEAVKVTLGEYQKIGKVTDKELKLAKEYLKGRLDLSLESSQEVAGEFGETMLLENKVRTVKEKKEKVDQVTKTDIKRVAERVFQKEQLSLTILGPFEEKSKFEKLLV